MPALSSFVSLSAVPSPGRRKVPAALWTGVLAVLLAAPASRPVRAEAPVRAVAEPAADASADPADAERSLALGFARHVERLVNEHRARHGLPALEVAGALAALAAEHSADMATSQRLSHGGFGARLQRARSPACVENVGWNHPTPESLLDGWRRSPSHARNLLDPAVARMGVAVRARYVTFFACR